MNKMRFVFLLGLAIALVGMVGCKPEMTTEPLTQTLHGVDADGNPALYTLAADAPKPIDARNGALISYQGGGGFASGTVKIWTLSAPNEPQTFDVSIMPSDTQVPSVGSKCLSCGATVVLVAAAVGTAGAVVDHIIGVVHTDSATGNFDISSVFGANVDHAQLAIVGKNKTFCLADLYGPGHYGATNTDKYVLTTMVSPENSGSINVNPDQAEYNFHDKVLLEAVPATGFVFDRWVVNAQQSSWTEANAEVYMDSNVVQVIAYFVPATTAKNKLKVVISPVGAGTVTVDPDKAEYNLHDKVAVKATANTGYVFEGWSVNGTAGATTVNAEVSMDSDVVTVTAKFTSVVTPPAKSVLEVVISPVGAGTVTVNPDQAEYAIGDKVTVKASANTGYTFRNWVVNGTVGISATEAEVTMSNDKVKVTAVFDKNSASDTTPPVLTLLGDNPMYLNVGTVYVELGATAIDAIDGNVGFTVTGQVIWSTVGTYVLVYHAVDLSGNSSTATRMVYVQDTGSTTNMVIDVRSDVNGNLTYTVVNGPANGVAGLELYQNSAPNVQRNTTTTNSSGSGSGALSNFRANLSRTLRCTAVLSPTTGAYVPNENVTVKLNGAVMPLVANERGEKAFQASF